MPCMGHSWLRMAWGKESKKNHALIKSEDNFEQLTKSMITFGKKKTAKADFSPGENNL